MSACESRTLLQLLVFCRVLVAAGQPDSQEPNEVFFRAMGSSAMLPGFSEEDFKDVEHVKWTFSKIKILDYYSVTNIPTFTDFYKYRSQFFSSNGSLLLRNVTKNDSGLYEVQINLHTTKVFQLNVLIALSEPSVSNNSTELGATIALNCGVSAGEVESRHWWKDGKLLMIDQHHWLLQDNSTLIIVGAKKSDCGNYTCSLENSVSSKNVSHWLPISGIPHTILCVMILSIVALIFALSVLMGIMFLCFHSDRKGTDFHGKALKCLQIASLLSLITLLAAFTCSTQSSEHSDIKIFMMVLLGVLIILTIFSMFSISTWNSESFNRIMKYKICSVTVDAVTPISGLVVTCASAIMLVRIAKQADKGCEPLHNLQRSIIPAVVGPIVLCSVSFAIYVHQHRKQRRSPQREGQAANQNEASPQRPQEDEQVPLQMISGENGSPTRDPVSGEDSRLT
ncbi:hepatic and glial cell adhesion molecule-like isoform X2 [Stegostoma tigrinum]|uniref:hepatic and glial cell adhesion molecule-like isoform X2 n=1 Tax=Stegostoma tigrinum TaxID=3053191 RepID=UPI0028703FDC|nr:hepatic and glial cell adhesion molecule-like isoform X2 [Stegostoma tigrinum]